MIRFKSLYPTLQVAFIMVIFLLVSCVPQKKIIYIQKKAEGDTTSEYANTRDVQYRVQPKDNLYIKINGLDEKTYQFFNRQGGSSGYINDYNTDASIYLNSYSISEEGTITLAILGKIYVKDLTVTRVKDTIQKRVDEYLKETTVTVKLVNFNVTVLGEVMHPGEFKIYQDRIDLFQAISMAGDMTEFANRNQVQLVRQTKTGSKVHYLDLTSDKILTSEFLYLMPNDIIYVSPLKIKRWGFTQFPYATIFTGLTALTSLLLLIYTLKL
jgi:polysaccharide biosynthesis/export protein